jgi:hypothetical protein
MTIIRNGRRLALLGRRDEAISALTEAISLTEQVALSGPQARALENLATIFAGESRHAYGRAAEAFEAMGDTEAAGRCHARATAAR